MAISTGPQPKKRSQGLPFDEGLQAIRASAIKLAQSGSRMTKSGDRRKRVKPIEQPSIGDKRFRRVLTPSKRITSLKVHPLIVLADLRRGSLVSLTSYLAQERSIPDRAVALELRKLISGSVYRSQYRLLVIEHPDRPKNRGGHPPNKRDEGTLNRYRQMFASYNQVLREVGRKAYLARERVAAEFKCDDTTVKRAIRTAREDRKKAQVLAETIERRETALANLRRGAKLRRG